MITGSQNAGTANIPRHTFAADQPLARRSVQAYSIDTWLYVSIRGRKMLPFTQSRKNGVAAGATLLSPSAHRVRRPPPLCCHRQLERNIRVVTSTTEGHGESCSRAAGQALRSSLPFEIHSSLKVSSPAVALGTDRFLALCAAPYRPV